PPKLFARSSPSPSRCPLPPPPRMPIKRKTPTLCPCPSSYLFPLWSGCHNFLPCSPPPPHSAPEITARSFFSSPALPSLVSCPPSAPNPRCSPRAHWPRSPSAVVLSVRPLGGGVSPASIFGGSHSRADRTRVRE